MAFAQPSKHSRSRGLRAPARTAFIITMILAAANVTALEIDAEGTFGNLGFVDDREVSDADLGSASYLWDARLALSGAVLDGFRLTGAYERDSVLRDTLTMTLGYSGQIMSVSAGPFLGFLPDSDNPYLLKPGLSAQLRAELWETGFLSLETDVTLDPQLSTSSTDFRQFRITPRAGIYLPNIITSLEFDRSTLFYTDGTDTTIDRRSEYALANEIFQKAIPYRILLRFAYRSQLKRFADGTKHALGAALFTPGVTYAPSETVTLRAQLENGIYVFGREELVGEIESDRYFFRATMGMTIQLP
ncbi:MAG: hypothetical protein GVY14_07010 [Spirochaetes bacterium]|nr:hypothetical protein [Spirochaetota bacterium]